MDNKVKPTYRMSECGGCPRAMAASRLGYDPTPDSPASLRMMREGKRHESWIVQDLKEMGYTIETAGVCQKCLEETSEEKEGIHVEFETPLVRMVGHLDGVDRRNIPVEWFLECIDPDHNGAFPKNKVESRQRSMFAAIKTIWLDETDR